MKHLSFLLLFLLAQISFSQDIDIPDPNFLNALIEEGVDSNGDGVIQVSEVEDVEMLNVENQDISDLTGINYFSSLRILEASNNQIEQVDDINLTLLRTLELTGNNLTHFSIDNLPNLRHLHISENQLTQLSIINSYSLSHLSCNNNLLEEVELINLENLGGLDVSNNKLTELSVASIFLSGSYKFLNLNCSFNQISSLDFGSLKNFYSINCSHNLLTELNIDNFEINAKLDCSHNQISNLDIEIYDLGYTESIDCSYNNLVSLNIVDAFLTSELNCSNNQLEQIDLSGLRVPNINLDSNRLVSLVVPNELRTLSARANLLTEFIYSVSDYNYYSHPSDVDLSGNNFIEFNTSENALKTSDLDLSNNQLLELINIKDGEDIQDLLVDNCPKLSYICTDLSEEDNFDNINVPINSLCPPGENWNIRVYEGVCTIDDKYDGCDIDDERMPNVEILIQNETDSIVIVSDANGEFSFIGPYYGDGYNVSILGVDSLDYIVTPLNIEVDPATQGIIEFCLQPRFSLMISGKFDSEENGCDSNDDSFSDVEYEIVSSNNGTELVSPDNTGVVSYDVMFSEYTITPINFDEGLLSVEPEQIVFNTNQVGFETALDFCFKPLPIIEIASHVDLDNNGCSISEVGLPFMRFVVFLDGNFVELITADEFGLYEYILREKGVYTISLANDVLQEYIVSPSEHIIDTNLPFDKNPTFCVRPFPKVILASRIDADMDGCENDTESLGNVRYEIDNGSNVFTIYSDQQGNTNALILSENYTIVPTNIDDRLYTFEPSEMVVDGSDGNLLDTLSFCLTRKPEVVDLCVETTTLDDIRPGFQARYRIRYRNPGTDPKSGRVDFRFEDEFMDYVSASVEPTTIDGGNLSFEYEDLQPNETRTITITVVLNTPMDDPALDGDEELTASTWVFPIEDDINRPNNFFLLKSEVRNSWDPNDKACMQGTELLEEFIGEFVHYKIRFENTGTADAINIVVRDTINLDDFDISTLEIIDASHNMETRIIDPNIVEFVFADINLPFDDANNDGYLIFKIKTLDDLTLGDDIANSAGIYFDFNFPIITNTARSEIVEPVSIKRVDEPEINVVISPNPVSAELSFTVDQRIYQYEIFDTKGQKIITKNASNRVHHTMSVSELTPGLYFLRLQGEDSSVMKSFVKY